VAAVSTMSDDAIDFTDFLQISNPDLSSAPQGHLNADAVREHDEAASKHPRLYRSCDGRRARSGHRGQRRLQQRRSAQHEKGCQALAQGITVSNSVNKAAQTAARNADV